MDRWLADLSGAETKVLLYLARRTFGFHRDRVEVGLRTICNGIPGKDRGTGLHIETASIAVKGLEARGLVIPKYQPGGRTTYTLPVSEVYGKSEHPRSEIPNSPAFGKSVHEERKSSSETNTEKKSLGPTAEQRPKKLARIPGPQTNRRNSPMKADDEKAKANPRPPYANPEDELRDLYRTKTGLEITPYLLSRLKETCELRRVTLTQYVETLRPHTPNAWSNPAGFLIDFARKIHSRTPGGNSTPVLLRIDPSVNETARCKSCGGVGIKNGDYCKCQLGRDLKLMEHRRAQDTDKAPTQTPETKAREVSACILWRAHMRRTGSSSLTHDPPTALREQSGTTIYRRDD